MYLRLLAMKELNAIRPIFNCFILMIISVDTLCGFASLESCEQFFWAMVLLKCVQCFGMNSSISSKYKF